MPLLAPNLAEVWAEYNSEESLWPFYLPLGVWLSSFLWCKLALKKDFHRWYTIHNIHNFGAILLGSLSIYSGSRQASASLQIGAPPTLGGIVLLNERVPILWSLSYFGVDIVDCALRRDGTYLVHAVCCFVLGVANYQTPLLRKLRMNSKATYCELSNPFMHLAKRTRKPGHFALFAFVFTLCRMLWIPFMLRQLMAPNNSTMTDSDGRRSSSNSSSLTWTHPIVLVLLAFYTLNAFWWFKIVRILYDGLVLKKKPEKED